jgi:acetyl esterase
MLSNAGTAAHPVHTAKRPTEVFQRLQVWATRKYYRVISRRGWQGHIEETPYSELRIPGPAGSIPARVYAGDTGADKPLIVYLHGGGWVIGDLDTHNAYCHTLRQRSGCSVIAVGYRLAPEHRFPAAAQDSLAATRWIAAHVDQLAPCNGKLVIAGDSAGANLATSTCLELDAGTRQQVVGEIVKYPVVDHYSAAPPSYTQRARGQMLTRNLMIWFWDSYLGDCAADDPAAKRAMPLHAENLASLPPTFLVTAEYDPLRDEGIAYAQKLQRAGVALRYRHFDTAAHGFACSEGPNDNFMAFMDDLVDWLQHLN